MIKIFEKYDNFIKNQTDDVCTECTKNNIKVCNHLYNNYDYNLNMQHDCICL